MLTAHVRTGQGNLPPAALLLLPSSTAAPKLPFLVFLANGDEDMGGLCIYVSLTVTSSTASKLRKSVLPLVMCLCLSS